MSRHIYTTTHQGKPATVALGFDRPLQGFFLTVGSDDGAEPDIYCNLDDPMLFPWGGLPPTLEPFQKQLQRLGIRIPERMLQEVRRDQFNNVGNRVEFYADELLEDEPLPQTYGEVLAPLDMARLPEAMRQLAASDPLVKEFIAALDRVHRAEKVSSWAQWTPSQAAAWADQNHRLFSRLRGYSDDEIAEFEQYLALAQQIDAKYGEQLGMELNYMVQRACSTPAFEAAERKVHAMGRAALEKLGLTGTADAF